MSFSQQINILLVEDSDSDATIILHALQQSPLPGKVHRVPTGEDALAVLYGDGEHDGTPRPDLILLDLNLPGLHGFDVLEAVKTNDDLKSIFVIIVTSSAVEEDVHRASRLRADLYLSKPINLEGYSDLVADIEKFCTAHASAD
jgi:two-component system response regulator